MVSAELTFKVERTPVPAGERVTVSGRLRDMETGKGIKNAPIKILQDETVIGTVRTDSTGNFTAAVRLPKVGRYTFKAHFPGGEF